MDAPKSNLELNDYIRDNLRQGRRYAHINQKLSESGWSKEEIDLAFKEVLSPTKKVAEQPKIVKTAPVFVPRATKPSAPLFSPSITKTLTTIVITVFLVFGVFFLLGGNVGQAIFFEKLVGGSKNATSGEVTYTVQCTPPHILNPDQSGCCLDSNSNGKCDFLEKEEITPNLTVEKECTDSSQCESRECLDGKCDYLGKMYSKPLDQCSKVCNFYNVDILTSDGELYSLKPREGSYTGAGALDWTILNAPDHCIEESPQVPIKIDRNLPGKTINSEIILLNKGESSKLLTHPSVAGLYFTLTVVNVYEVCDYSVAELQATLAKQKVLQTQLQVKS